MTAPYHLMAKPAGAACNLACTYCFYLSRWEDGKVDGMTPELLERYVKEHIATTPGPDILFAWQGGEPTLMGLEYYRQAVALQQWHCPPGKRVANAFQTNGVLLDDAWCAFFAEHGFLIGLSIDGPPEIHDSRRVSQGGKPTAQAVIRAAKLLVKHGVEFNLLCAVGSHNAGKARQVYRFLTGLGTAHLQFIPLVERRKSATPHDFAGPQDEAPLDSVSVTGADWGRFLIGIFDQWVVADVGRVYVRDFDNWLGLWIGRPSEDCIHSVTCGRAMAVEKDGSIYSCDHFVYPEYRLGKIGEQSLVAMIDSAQQQAFGNFKRDHLPEGCRTCRYRALCNGGCPKHWRSSAPGLAPTPHLCDGWIAFFDHAGPAFTRVAELLAQEQAPALVMRDRAVLRKLGLVP